MFDLLQSQLEIALNNLLIVAENHLEQNNSPHYTTADNELLKESIKLVTAYKDNFIYKTKESK
jgi:hypothetical protein